MYTDSNAGKEHDPFQAASGYITVIIASDKYTMSQTSYSCHTRLTCVHSITLIAHNQTQEFVALNALVSLYLVMLLTVKTCLQLCRA